MGENTFKERTFEKNAIRCSLLYLIKKKNCHTITVLSLFFFVFFFLQASDSWHELLPPDPVLYVTDVWALFSEISQVVRGRRSRRQLLLEVDGVLRPAHQQVEHVRSYGQEARRSGRGDVQQLPVRRGRTRRPRLQPLFSALRLCREVGKNASPLENKYIDTQMLRKRFWIAAGVTQSWVGINVPNENKRESKSLQSTPCSCILRHVCVIQDTKLRRS